MIARTKIKLIAELMTKEEDAITDFSTSSPLLLANLTCAFFNNPLLVASKMEVVVRKSAQVPICAGESHRIKKTKFARPNSVRENL
jgi:hypothetical protein